MEKGLVKQDQQRLEVINKLDAEVLSIVGNGDLEGFEKAFKVAEAIDQLNQLLSPEYMKPIMKLQGNRLGFRTDKDTAGGYREEVVKNCLIEAVLTGLQPVGNQFNIIAGNMYPTKEGFGYLLKEYPGLKYKITPNLPRINNTNTSAAIVMNISYSLNGGTQKEEALEIPIRINKGMGTDAIIGKATRKARAWLYNTITGCEVTDGDVTDLGEAEIVEPTAQEQAAKKEQRQAIDFIDACKSMEDLESVRSFAETSGGDVLDAFEAKENQLKQ